MIAPPLGPIMPATPAGIPPYYGVSPFYNVQTMFPGLGTVGAFPPPMLGTGYGMGYGSMPPFTPSGAFPMMVPPTPVMPPQPVIPQAHQGNTHPRNKHGDWFQRLSPFKSQSRPSSSVPPSYPLNKPKEPTMIHPAYPQPTPPAHATAPPVVSAPGGSIAVPAPPSTGFNVNVMASGNTIIVNNGATGASVNAAPTPAPTPPPSPVYLPPAGSPQPFYPNTPLPSSAPLALPPAGKAHTPQERDSVRQLLKTDPTMAPLVAQLKDEEIDQLLNDPQMGPMFQQASRLAPPTPQGSVAPTPPSSTTKPSATPPLAPASSKEIATLRKLLAMDPQTAPLASQLSESDLTAMLAEPQIKQAVQQLGPMIDTLPADTGQLNAPSPTPSAPHGSKHPTKTETPSSKPTLDQAATQLADPSVQAMAQELSKSITPEQARQLLADPSVQALFQQANAPSPSGNTDKAPPPPLSPPVAN
ncbi:MAG: hypothetical protein ACKO34_07345 [Vampirovibrionales bacterium]